jgi:hypothetical protein
MTTDKIMNWVVGFDDWCFKNKQKFIEKQINKMSSHDCHYSSEDGCPTCEIIYQLNEIIKHERI